MWPGHQAFLKTNRLYFGGSEVYSKTEQTRTKNQSSSSPGDSTVTQWKPAPAPPPRPGTRERRVAAPGAAAETQKRGQDPCPIPGQQTRAPGRTWLHRLFGRSQGWEWFFTFFNSGEISEDFMR